MNNNFKLGRSIAQIVPFQVTKQILEQKDKITFEVIILVSLAILIIKIVVLAFFDNNVYCLPGL